MTAPRMMSATMLSSVWDTTRSEHDRKVLARAPGPPGHHERARGLAESRRQRRGHEHPDERALHRIGQAHVGAGQRGLEDRVPGEGAHGHRAAHDGETQEHEGGARVDERLGDVADADLLQGQEASTTPPSVTTPQTGAGARCAIARLPVLPSLGSRLGRRRARHVRLEVGGAQADADGGALHARSGLGRGDRVLVGLHHLGGDARPREALDVGGRGAAPCSARRSGSS